MRHAHRGLVLMLAVGCGGGSNDTAAGDDTAADTEPGPYGSCEGRVEIDEEADGELDEIETLRFNAAGQMTELHLDEGADGTTDESTWHTYNADGLEVSTEYDLDGDGAIDEAIYFTYDASGNPTMRENDSDGDGTIDSVTVYLYDADGFLVSAEVDDGNDGFVDTVYTFTRDADGVLTERVAVDVTSGDVVERLTYTWSADRLTVVVEEDSDGDGSVDEITTRIYDEEERLISYDNESAEDRLMYTLRYTDLGQIDTREGALFEAGEFYYQFLFSYSYDAEERVSEIDLTFGLTEGGSYDDYIILNSHTWDCGG